MEKPRTSGNHNGSETGDETPVFAWIIGGLVSLFAALTFAEVAILIPKTGGMVAYLSDAYDERLGFPAGWMQVIIFYPAFLAGYGVKAGSELGEWIGERYVLPVGIIVIIVLAALNCMGSRTAGGMQVISTACKLIPLILLMIFGFIKGKAGGPVFSPMIGEGKNAGGVQ